MKKITLEEFFNSKEGLAIHCDTEDKAKKLLKAFDRLGKIWSGGDSYLELNRWEDYKENTCYTNKSMYCEERFYKKKRCRVIEFEDIDLGETKMKKKIRDLTSEEYREWKLKNCSNCLDCPFNYVNCKMWVNHKYMYSNKFLDQEVDIPSPHILDKEEHDYLRAVCKPYKVIYIKKTETGSGNQFIEIVVKSSVFCDLIRSWSMPYFAKDTMYKGMEVDKEYTIQDLELDKEWEK